MLRKIALVMFLIISLVATIGNAPITHQHQLITFTPVFKPTVPAGGWTYLWGKSTQFGSAFYTTTSSSAGGQIWRSIDGTTWKAVTSPGFGVDPAYVVSWDQAIFNGKMYVAANTFNWSNPNPNIESVFLRSMNGKDWEAIHLAAGDAVLDKLGVFQDRLYATTVNAAKPDSIGQIWRSSSGNPGTWKVVKDLGPGVNSSSSPTEFNGKVYISGFTTGSQSMSIWSSRDGLKWDTNQIKITDGDSNVYYIRDGMLKVFNNELYLSTINNLEGGAIYRTRDGKKWDLVFQSRNPTGNFVFAVDDMIVYHDVLYIAAGWTTQDLTDVGVQIWRSQSGNPGSWVKMSEDGSLDTAWSDRGSLGLFKDRLYLADEGLWLGIPVLYRVDQ